MERRVASGAEGLLGGRAGPRKPGGLHPGRGRSPGQLLLRNPESLSAGFRVGFSFPLNRPPPPGMLLNLQGPVLPGPPKDNRHETCAVEDEKGFVNCKTIHWTWKTVQKSYFVNKCDDCMLKYLGCIGLRKILSK